MSVPELKKFHQILRTQNYQGLVLIVITVLAGKLFSWCAPQAEQDPWENINTTGIPQASLHLSDNPTRSMTTLPWASNQHGHKNPQWVRLEQTALESPGPMSLLRQDHLRPHGIGLCPDSSEYPQWKRLHTLPGQTDNAVLVGVEAVESRRPDWRTPVSVSSLHTAADPCYVITSGTSVSCQVHTGCKSNSDLGSGTDTAWQGALTFIVRVEIWSFSR